jgi:hypothetical protein
MAEIVYILCALTSFACAVLLARGYVRGRSRLLLWSAVCFAGLTLNNFLLFLDLVIYPDVDLSLWRGLAGVGGLAFLLYGMIWDAD